MNNLNEIKMWKIKKRFINYTQRETLFYRLVTSVIESIQMYINFLLKWHFVRQRKIDKYLANHEIKKIQFGCGTDNLQWFLNTDAYWEIPLDITNKLPFKDNTFEVLYSNHLVEHIYKKDFIWFLKESFRIQKSWWIHIICCPSMEKVALAMYAGDKETRHYILDQHLKEFAIEEKVFPSSYMNDLIHVMFRHRYIYDFELIKYLWKQTWYSKIERVPNLEVPDKTIQEYITSSTKKHVTSKDKFRDLTSDTYVFYK